MFTRKRFPTLQLTGDWAKDGPELLRVLNTYLLSLETKNALTINEAEITASQGIKFPATQIASSDANTLDDYEEGTWTPVFTFATPGNLAVTYSVQQADYTKIGRVVICNFNLVTSAFTHTTASGIAVISGLPFTATSDANLQIAGSCFWAGITKAGYTQVVPVVASSATGINFIASGSGVAASFVAFGDMPTGGAPQFRGCIVYRV